MAYIFNPITQERYIPKVEERKYQPNTDWAELVRYQQALGEQMIQREKEKRLQQKREIQEVLGTLVNEKQAMKQMELYNKQKDYYESVAAKKNFDDYLSQVKTDRSQVQKTYASEYDREKEEKNFSQRNQTYQEKQIEQKIVHEALDSLEKEKLLNEQKKLYLMTVNDQMLREKDAQKKKQKLWSEQNKQEHIKLMDEHAYNLDMKDLNYKLYYQRISDKQNNLQKMHDQQVAQGQRERDQQVEGFINKGIQETQIKNEEELMRRQMKRQEQLKESLDDIRAKINMHQQEKTQEKSNYYNKVDTLRRMNQEMDEQNGLMRQLKADQTVNYQSTLKDQMKEAEQLKKKQNAEMTLYEKKLHFEQFEGLVPGLKSSKFEQLLSPQIKSLKDQRDMAIRFNQMSQTNLGMSSPNSPERLTNSDYLASAPNRMSLPGSFDAPISAKNPNKEIHNPITNPMPHNIQNPYIAKDFQRTMGQRTIMATVADKNIFSPAK